MATTIEAASLVRGPRREHSALRLAVTAGQAALRRGQTPPTDIDLLLNAGIYRDRVLGEPALAALIQEDVGANPEDPHVDGHGTFSFDVSNGPCGVLTSLMIADRFLQSATIECALIVASDADPGHRLAPEFPYAPVGGAILCRRSIEMAGLGTFRWANECDERSFRATVGHINGANALHIVEDESFGARAAELAAAVALEALAVEKCSPGAVDLVLAAPGGSDFAAALQSRLGIDADRIVTPPPDVHTAGLVATLGLAADDGRLAAAATTLLVGAGAGLTAGAVLYRGTLPQPV